MPGYGIADAATTLVGQSLGAGRKELTLRFARITVMPGMAALRIEAFAEPMFAASIVAYGVFLGAADTLIPCLMNFFSIWAVRLSLAALLAPSMGLQGVWIAMCIELCFRGTIFLIRLQRGKWMNKLL